MSRRSCVQALFTISSRVDATHELAPDRRPTVFGTRFRLCSSIASIVLIVGVLLIAPSAWSQTIYELGVLEDADVGNSAGAGISLAISDSWIATGSDAANSPGSGYVEAVHLFDRGSGQWQRTITTPVPPMGNDLSRFGISVALDSGLLAVGAPSVEPIIYSYGVGRVYLYDPATGALLRTLAPGDDQSTSFGASLAMEAGTLAIGAPRSSGIFPRNWIGGAVYLIDPTTGAELAKLGPDESYTAANQFGTSVALDGNVLAVGDPGSDASLSSFGSVYLFDLATELQTAKLQPMQTQSSGEFGASVALYGDRLVAGAPRATIDGIQTGAVYVYDIPSGNIVHQLVPSDGFVNQRFGEQVAIDGDIVLVGCRSDNGYAGSVYVFDITTGTQIAKLLASDGESNDALGSSVWLEGTRVFAGATRRNVEDNPIRGAVYVFDLRPDADGDGLYDEWEEEGGGIPYLDAMGATQLLELPGADPNHKDLYLEIDAMSTVGVPAAALTQVEAAFAAAPVENPDGMDGITIHFLVDDLDLTLASPWTLAPDGFPADFDTYSDNYFGTAGERGNSDATALLEAKSRAYRYAIFADASSVAGKGGVAGIGGDAMAIFAGIHLDEDELAGTLMHEFGHNLRLDHGGPFGQPSADMNGKPNHPSIMNYVFASEGGWNSDFYSLDFARNDGLLSLDETSIDESIGIGSPTGYYANYLAPIGFDVVDGGGNVSRSYDLFPLNGTPIDVGSPDGSMIRDGVISSGGVVQDLNYVLNPPPNIQIPSTPTPGDTLHPYDEWSSLRYQLLGAHEITASLEVPMPEEVTLDAQAWVTEALPEPATGSGLALGSLLVGTFARARARAARREARRLDPAETRARRA